MPTVIVADASIPLPAALTPFTVNRYAPATLGAVVRTEGTDVELGIPGPVHKYEVAAGAQVALKITTSEAVTLVLLGVKVHVGT